METFTGGVLDRLAQDDEAYVDHGSPGRRGSDWASRRADSGGRSGLRPVGQAAAFNHSIWCARATADHPGCDEPARKVSRPEMEATLNDSVFPNPRTDQIMVLDSLSAHETVNAELPFIEAAGSTRSPNSIPIDLGFAVDGIGVTLQVPGSLQSRDVHKPVI